jgi:phosphoadenosine phosphosulfate reductase
MEHLDIELINGELKDKNPIEIITWALEIAERPILTTNFGPYSASMLHAAVKVKNDINVIWCDTGYNTSTTYKFAHDIIETLDLNIEIFVPKNSAAYRDVILGIPDINNPLHQVFSEQVKLEPFKRAMKKYKPDVWFANLRKGQTAYRNSLNIVSLNKEGVLKVSPFYHWTDAEIEIYLKENNLPNEFRYFDPTKVLENRECGIHI